MKKYNTPLFKFIYIDYSRDVLDVSDNTNWEIDPWDTPMQ